MQESSNFKIFLYHLASTKRGTTMHNLKRIACFLVVLQLASAAAARAQMTIEFKDYVTMPITGLADGKGNNDVLLSRVNGIRQEPGGANRFFVPDLIGPLYITE